MLCEFYLNKTEQNIVDNKRKHHCKFTWEFKAPLRRIKKKNLRFHDILIPPLPVTAPLLRLLMYAATLAHL